MKVLQINAVYGYRSTGNIVKDIDLLLQSKLDDSYVICVDAVNNSSNLLFAGNFLENGLHALLTRMFGIQGYGNWFSTVKLIKKIKKLDPDIIHLHNLHSNYINIFLLLKYCVKARKPVVVTLHDCWFFTGKCYHFDDINCNRWKIQCYACPKKKLDIPIWFWDTSRVIFRSKKNIFRQLQKLSIVGCSKWITELSKQSPMFKNASFKTIYNGIDISVFNGNLRRQNDDGRFRILVMANKWFLPQNKPMRQFLLDNLSSDYVITVVGCSAFQLDNREQSGRLIKIGYISSPHELAAIYRDSDVFINMTLVDTLPTVNMESLSCGTPVITYRSGGSPELIVENETGYVVEPLDTLAVMDAINKVKRGLISRKRCMEYAALNFEKELNYNMYYKLYKSILENIK